MQRKNRQRAIAIAITATRQPALLPVVVTATVVATVLSPAAGLGVVAAALAWVLAEG